MPMPPRIQSSGFCAADLVLLQFGIAELTNRRQPPEAAAAQPFAIGGAAQSRLQTKIVEYDEAVISRQLHVQFGGVISSRSRGSKSRPGCFPPYLRPSPA